MESDVYMIGVGMSDLEKQLISLCLYVAVIMHYYSDWGPKEKNAPWWMFACWMCGYWL